MAKRKAKITVDTSAPVTPEEDDLAIPKFLRRSGNKLTDDEVKRLLDESTGRTREWKMPGKDWQPKESMQSIMARYEGADRPDQPVRVQVALTDKAGSTMLAEYPDWVTYEAKHDAKTYPVKRVQSIDGTTVVLVRATPWAGKERAPAKPREGKSKAEVIGELLLEGGKTAKELCDAVGWPAMSVPAQAKAAGLVLRKEKVDGVTRYWGSKA